MCRFAIPEIYRRLVAPSRGRADRIGSHRVGRFEDRQAGPEPEVDSWRDIISSEAVLGRLEAIKRPGREVGRSDAWQCVTGQARPFGDSIGKQGDGSRAGFRPLVAGSLPGDLAIGQDVWSELPDAIRGRHRGNGQGGLQVIAFSPVVIGPGGGRFIHRPRPPAPLYREPYEREARENRKPSLIPRNHPSVVLPSARARSRTMRPELELEGAGITAGGMTCGCGRAGCGSVPAGGSAMLRSCVVTVVPTTLESATRGRLLTTPVATDRQRIDNESRVELGAAALGELCRRCVDRAGHARGVAADREGLGIVAWLENHDSRVGPGRKRTQVV